MVAKVISPLRWPASTAELRARHGAHILPSPYRLSTDMQYARGDPQGAETMRDEPQKLQIGAWGRAEGNGMEEVSILGACP